jgi:hypothetical protein
MSSESEHPSEDLIALYAYGEGADDERGRITAHLGRCVECRRVAEEFEEFRHLSNVTEAPDPGADFEARMWARIQPSLPAPRRAWSGRNVVMVAAWAATIVLAVLSGTWLARQAPGTSAPAAEPIQTAAGADMRERVLFTALDSHLGQTEALLVELMNAPATASEMNYERQAADDLVNSGRLYRRTATETGHALYSALLDEVEPVLVEVARAPETLAARDLAALRERIVEGDLLFKVRAAARGARDRQDAGEL